MSAASDRVSAFRERAVELVNAGRLRVRPLPHGEVKEMPDGSAFVEVVTEVPAAAIAPSVPSRCWRRRGPCERCDAHLRELYEQYMALLDGLVPHLKGEDMNEREAWTELADAWDAAVETADESVVVFVNGTSGDRAHGLCGSITLLPGLSDEVRATMQAKVSLPDGSYRWPLTVAGAAQRAAFCREQAALIA